MKRRPLVDYWIGITSVIGIGTIAYWMMQAIFWLVTGTKF